MRPAPLSMKWEYFVDSRDYQTAAAAWKLELLSPEDSTWVAASALQRGVDTQTIREVAGLLSPTRRDDGEKIERMFAELGVGVPETAVALQWLVPSLLFRIVEGDANEFDGVMGVIWNLRLDVSDEPNRSVGTAWKRLVQTMYEWDDLYDVLGPFGYAASPEKLDRKRLALVAKTRSWATQELTRVDGARGGP